MWSSAEIFGAPVIEPPGKTAASSSAKPTPSRSSPRRGRRGARPRRAAARRAARASAPTRLADARQVVPLEVDDHHVLGCVLLGGCEVAARAERPRALDRLRPDPPAAAGKEQLRRGGDDRPAVPDERPRRERPQRRQRLRQPTRIARERRGEMLDEVDLVDVAGGDRRPHRLDRRAVLLLRPGPLPRADPNAPPAWRAGSWPDLRLRPAAAGTARAGRARGAPERRRQAVAEEHVGDEALGSRLRKSPRARRKPSSSAIDPNSSTGAYANLSAVRGVIVVAVALLLAPAAQAASLRLSAICILPGRRPDDARGPGRRAEAARRPARRRQRPPARLARPAEDAEATCSSSGTAA